MMCCSLKPSVGKGLSLNCNNATALHREIAVRLVCGLVALLQLMVLYIKNIYKTNTY